MAEDVRHISRRLCHVLDKVGASEEMRLLSRKAAKRHEILSTLQLQSYDSDVWAFVCGSRYEGSYTLELMSDVDIVFFHGDILPVEDIRVASPGTWLTVIRDEWNYPGYVKLQSFNNREPLTVGDLIDSPLLMAVSEPDIKGRICMKQHSFQDKHGPAKQILTSSGLHCFDRVPGVRCKDIPSWSKEWMDRPRKYGWPSSKHIAEMSDLGCLMVSIGHEQSPEIDVEYRLSFTLQERYLMSSLNVIQHKVYILLKMIKKDLIEPVLADKVLTSYHLKTCVLQLAENTPISIWRDDNITNCVHLCLKTLHFWVENVNCPSFFIKDQNLFYKRSFMLQKQQLSTILQSLLTKCPDIFYLIKKDRVGELLTDEGYQLQSVLADKMKARFVLSVISLNFTLPWYVVGVKQIRQHLLGLVEKFKSVSMLPYHSAEDTQYAMRRIIPSLHLNIGKDMLCAILLNPTASNVEKLMDESTDHLRLATPIDLVQGRFVEASYLYIIGQYSMSYMKLCLIENIISDGSIAACACTREFYLYGRSIQWETEFMSMTADKMESKLIHCVTFLPSERDLVPVALHPEMDRSKEASDESRTDILEHWFDNAVVDSVIYLYFMKYLVSKQMGDLSRMGLAMQELIRSIHGGLGHLETAYNLLGWIHKEENRPGDAIRCFLESWKVRPHHNAAKIHIRDMADKFMELIQLWKMEK